MQQKLWTPYAWLNGRWQDNVLLEIDSAGRWQAITPGVPQPADARALKGPVLPPLVDAHSHAFQRAMAGLAETRDSDSDDFWSWREAMYGVALSIQPDELKSVATRLYKELLRGGYTQVCEFHYLQHQPDGKPYEDELALTWALVEAAQDAGIGLTMLPVLYAHQGFGVKGLKDTQRRFKTDADWVFHAQRRINAQASATLNAGVAFHSLRGAHAEDISALMKRLGEADLPIHIHAAEQTGEVRDCVAQTGMRPIEWLCKAQGLDARWQLVHATHAEAFEVELLAQQGAGVVICPTTEANLGDGLAPLAGYLDAGVPLTVGSDSEVGREWREELRWLEYGQRLVKRQRNVASQPGKQASSAARLFDAMLAGSARAAGFAQWGLQAGARADWLVLDPAAEGLEGVPLARRLDALVFASAGPLWAEIGVAGRVVTPAP
ncbi:formimidoylglutamate deiminase [Inhella sp. 4Y17]|uniref:Formimidoylglutamate deiminase n=2 Tax=Inhella gelatinilytica TaxID=2795030 RepID=A0A931IVX7_9BURK|nr:formimidoylglutamate deiminase [Inhella gelatinilytica]